MCVNAFSMLCKRNLALSAAVVCLIAATSVAAVAMPKTEVVRGDFDSHTGRCCTQWDVSVSVSEPETLVPIVVTWSTDYQSNAPFMTGLSLNGGYCTFLGPAFIPTFNPTDNTFASTTLQWVIMPGDYGLVRGKNVITVCDGGVFAETDNIVLGFNTLTARVGK
jgi:hypothetical protein